MSASVTLKPMPKARARPKVEADPPPAAPTARTIPECLSCRAWMRSSDHFGECRSRPPVAGINGAGVWPSTNERAWCLDWTEHESD